jgi:hypothetical protein
MDRGEPRPLPGGRVHRLNAVLRRKLTTLRGLHREGALRFLRPRYLSRLAYLYVLDRVRRRRYRTLGLDELLAARTSDTAFVFGSGRSLVDIVPEEWRRIEACNTISLREFPRQQWVRADFHLTSEVDFLEDYARRLRENPLYANTVHGVQEGFRAERGNELLGKALLPAGTRVFRFRRIRRRGPIGPPSRSLGDGLVHGASSIFDAVNFAYLMGFRRIVLAGVDLYNKEYFWLSPGETRAYEKPGISAERPFAAAHPIVGNLGEWRAALAAEDVELLVYDPRSLAAETLPVFRFG